VFSHLRHVSKCIPCICVSVFRGKLYELSCDSWGNVPEEDIRQKMARMATSAAWGLGINMFVCNECVCGVVCVCCSVCVL